MKKITTLVLSVLGFGAFAQTTITNGGFENWGNAAPGISSEPTGWYSNKSGSTIAQLANPTCFKDSLIVHSGHYSVQLQTITYALIEVVNGVVTTGVVNAPSTSKSAGYLGSVNYTTTTDDRRMPFTGRPDSLVGWYRYTQGGASEQGKIRAILHTNDYFDPETPTTYHPDPTADKIADLTFLTPLSNVATWTRFSMPFNYVSSSSPAYIMINATPSANQNTSVSGSKMWIDDLEAVYNLPSAVNSTVSKEEDVTVYAYHKNVCVNFTTANTNQSVLTIFDITGKKVFSQPISNEKFNSFNLTDLTTGIYIYQLANDDYRKTGKLFLQ